MIWEILLIILSFIFVLVGIIGVVMPFLPGVPLAWLGILLFGLVTNFAAISLKNVVVFLILTIAVSALDFLIPLAGASKYKASKEGLWGAALGAILGMVAGGPFGFLLGFISGIILGEVYHGRESHDISRILYGTLMGFLFGGLLKLVLALVMLGYLISGIFNI